MAAFLFLLVFLWGPISYVQRPLVILAFAVIAALGVEFLRRKAARDFPDAAPGTWAATSAAVGGAATRRSPSQAEELERLAGLHAAGTLTDEEFALAKARVLAP